MLGRFRFASIVATEPAIKVFTGSDVKATRLRAPQDVNVIHTESRVNRCERMVGVTGFEPATSWSQTRRSTKLSYTPSIL